MKMYRLISVLLALALLAGLAGCAGKSPEQSVLLYLNFDDGSGLSVADVSANQADAKVSYTLAHAVFGESQDPQWRENGIQGGCLLFDGGDTYISYKAKDLSVGGTTFSVSAWVAPRTFEWDDPNAAANGTDTLTGIVGQTDKNANKGFLLGYQRFGRLSFQVGTGSQWLTLWTPEGVNLNKYAWNHVVAVFDGEKGTMTLYLNGQEAASRTIDKGTAITAANKQLLVGRNGDGSQLAAGFEHAMSGYLDELKLYGCALTAGQVEAAYSAVTVPEIPFAEIWLQNILTGDVTRPQYHGGPYQFWMNEPHAPVYYNGMYHLFFQENMSGAYWRNICWGHMVSTDMVRWKPVKEAIVPTEGSVVPDGVWSGNATLDRNGVPLLFFTAGNDDFQADPSLISNQNIGIAYPADLTDPELTDWVIYDTLAVVQQPGQGRTGEFRDPYIWKEGDTWCMLICSGSVQTNGGSALLYTSETLELLADGRIDMDWQYRGPVYEMENQSMLYGTSWELPILLPVTNRAGTITKYVFSISPAPAGVADNKVYYWLGDFDLSTGKFTPDERFNGIPEMLDYGSNVFTGPSVLVDPVSGEVCVFSIMQDQRSAAQQGSSGWAHTVGLCRNIWLSDDGADLMIAPSNNIRALETNVLAEGENLTVAEANDLLSGVDTDMLHLEMTLDLSQAEQAKLTVKSNGSTDHTDYIYQVAESLLEGQTSNKGEGASTSFTSGALELENGRLKIELYIDRSLVEGFFNDRKALTIRAYPEDPKSAQQIFLEIQGSAMVEALRVTGMRGIF